MADIELWDIDAEINNMGADIEEGNYMNDLNAKTTNHDDIDAEISNTGADIEEENSDIELQIGNLQKDIDIKNINIASMGKNPYAYEGNE